MVVSSLHVLNMSPIVQVFSLVSKPDKSNVFREWHLLNILVILITFLVSQPDKLTDKRLIQDWNIEAITDTFDVLR